MRELILVFILILFSPHSYSQWIDQSFNQTPLMSIKENKFLNSNTGFFAGGSGKILKTTNGGNNWNLTVLSPVIDIYGIDFINSNTGMLIGAFNSQRNCFKSTDGGSNWVMCNLPNNKVYHDLKFLDQNNVICAGDSGLIIKSNNLGANWNVIQTPTIETLASIFVVDSLRCFVSGANGIFLRSSDGGLNWDLLSVGSSNYFGSIFFINGNTGYVGSSSTPLIKKTTNGGLFWTTLNTGSTPVTEISSIFFPSANTGYLTSFYDTGMGYQEVILKTVNGGANWNNVTTTHRIAPLRTSYFTSNDTGWVAGDGNFILKTTNGGLTYAPSNNQIIPDFSLCQNYPNPFNPYTVISYKLSVAGFTILNVYDVNGKFVKELVSGKQNAGNYEVNFSGEGLASGVYYYSLIAEGKVMDTKKMILLK
jgi:photosystem II stability/assembly factor-like uncharacterized protein